MNPDFHPSRPPGRRQRSPGPDRRSAGHIHRRAAKAFFLQRHDDSIAPVSFAYLLLLARKTKEVVMREEIYSHLWPGEMNYSGTNKPYERQISDHKRKLIAQIRKGITGKIAVGTGELETLIFTRPKIGYMLNLTQENVLILSQ